MRFKYHIVLLNSKYFSKWIHFVVITSLNIIHVHVYSHLLYLVRKSVYSNILINPKYLINLL